MRKIGAFLVTGALILYAGTACGNGGKEMEKKGPDGKALFETHCASCHKDGGNIINPKKTLSGSDLKANGITDAAGIVKIMRSPGTGMPPVGKETLSDEEAEAVAKYILKTW